MSPVTFPGLEPGAGLLIDTNLIVLLVVGSVNRDRIENFKRTRQYTKSDYDLLVKIIGKRDLYTVAHVMAEVSNLTDLDEPERLRARRVLASMISIIDEPQVSSLQASEGSQYERLGLVDSAISIVARKQKCSVLTDDFALYLSLTREGLPAVKFTHLRELNW
jgi:rRNA-processing protein FCF1